ncbi:MAG TPA: GGDEF domain-containing protein [bacterium]|nr:GGDEF domain-containing protein [bacterium]
MGLTTSRFLTVRSLLVIVFLLIVGLWFALRVYQVEAVAEIRDAANFVAAEAGRDVEQIEDLQDVVQEYHSIWQEVWQAPEARHRRKLESNRRRFNDILSRFGREAFHDKKSGIDALSKLYFEQTRSLLGESMLMSAQKERVEGLYRQILSEIEALKQVQEEAQEQIVQQGRRVAQTQQEKDLIFLASSLAALAGVIALIWTLLGAPLTGLARGVRLLEAEKWEKPIPVRGFGEISDLIRAFNRMAETIKKQKEELVLEATTDELTGILNFRAFQERVQEELTRAGRMGKPLSLILADIDHFKEFNDTYGHLAGNEALKTLAALLKRNSRRYDLAARFGGEEFALVLPETDGIKAAAIAERFRAAAAAHDHGLTISCGVAAYPAEAKDLDGLIARADQKLYAAKSAGRNRVVA